MRHYSRYIILGGSLLAFLCFSLPWKHIYSGAVLANSKGWSVTLFFYVALTIAVFCTYLLFRQPSVETFLITFSLIIGILASAICFASFVMVVSEGLNFVTISFVASVEIVGISIYVFNRTVVSEPILRLGILISSLIGVCCFLLLFFSGSYIIGSNSRIDNTRYGAFLTAIGYMVVIIGYLCLEKPKVSSIEFSEEENKRKQNPEGDSA